MVTPPTSPPVTSSGDIERVFRAKYGRCVATLIRLFGDIDLAEEAVQDRVHGRRPALTADRAATQTVTGVTG